jgi:hypothetical protein
MMLSLTLPKTCRYHILMTLTSSWNQWQSEIKWSQGFLGSAPVLFQVLGHRPSIYFKNSDIKHDWITDQVHLIADLSKWGRSIRLFKYMHSVRYLFFRSKFNSLKLSLRMVSYHEDSHPFLSTQNCTQNCQSSFIFRTTLLVTMCITDFITHWVVVCLDSCGRVW